MKKQKWKRKLIPLVCCSAVMLSTPIYAAGIKMQNVNYDQGNQQLNSLKSEITTAIEKAEKKQKEIPVIGTF